MARAEMPRETVPKLVGEIGADLRQLVSDEIQLAKTELGDSLRRGMRLAAGGLLALMGAGLLLIFALVLLVVWIPNHVLVAGIVAAAGLLMLLAGALVIWVNRHLWPFTETRRSLQEDLEWARLRTRRGRR